MIGIELLSGNSDNCLVMETSEKPQPLVSKRWERVFIVFAYLIGSIAIWYTFFRVKESDCNYSMSMEVQDRDMAPFLATPVKGKLFPHYYDCHGAKIGDIVAYRFSEDKTPFIRIIRAAEGDEVKLMHNDEVNGWNLEVNEKAILHQGKPHSFGIGVKTATLSLYLGVDQVKKLGDTESVILSTVPPSFLDSSAFGLRNIHDFMGKIEIPSEIASAIQHYVETGEVQPSTLEEPR